MKLHVPTVMMSIKRRRDRDQNNAIVCVLHTAPGDFPEFARSGMPHLVFEPSRPTMVGWRWDHGPDHDPDEPDDQHNAIEPSTLEFTNKTDGCNSVWGLIPEEQSTYQVEAEIDTERRTIWFPLPTGNCVHSLAHVLGLHSGWALHEFVRDWLFDRTPDTCEFSIDFGESGSTDEGFEVIFNVEDAPTDEYKSMHLMIPKELLQDPIANGSKEHDDGFNPWNEEQKARIIAYLEPRLPRLISFFETTANADRENKRFVSEEWEEGLWPFIPSDKWIWAKASARPTVPGFGSEVG